MQPRHAYLLLGWLCVGLGLLGALLPLMPTTVFLLIAAWAFSRSSPRWHRWLREHPRFGHLVRGWEEHHAMPARAKRIAWATMALSWALTAALFGPASTAALACGLCLLGVACYIARLPVIETSRQT
jgi:hypothetical protein